MFSQVGSGSDERVSDYSRTKRVGQLALFRSHLKHLTENLKLIKAKSFFFFFKKKTLA